MTRAERADDVADAELIMNLISKSESRSLRSISPNKIATIPRATIKDARTSFCKCK